MDKLGEDWFGNRTGKGPGCGNERVAVVRTATPPAATAQHNPLQKKDGHPVVLEDNI
jgi:hypothetical protein